MLKKMIVFGVLGFTSFVLAEEKEMKQEDYTAALKCLEKMNAANPYNWKSGASPYTYDEASKDHFVVLGRDSAFVRFGTTKPQKCTFDTLHNGNRDCIIIKNESGVDILTMKRPYKNPSKMTCDKKNPDSITKYKYGPEKACTDVPYSELGQILQKQILVNTEKLIVEKNLSRKEFDATYRKDCESVHKNLWDNVGSDYGATVSEAVKKAIAKAAEPAYVSEVPQGENAPCTPYPSCANEPPQGNLQ